LGEEGGIDVAAADYGYGCRVGRELGGVEEEGGGGYGSAGLGNQARGGYDGAHGGANFGFGDGDDAFDKGLDVGEVALAYALGAQSICDGAAGQLGGPGDDPASAEAFGGVAGQLGFDAEDSGLGANLLDGGGYSAEQAAAADGGEDEIDFGEGLYDFKAAGGLAGDDLLVVIRGNDDVAVLGTSCSATARRSLEARPTSTI